jgi:hypothetical protein
MKRATVPIAKPVPWRSLGELSVKLPKIIFHYPKFARRHPISVTRNPHTVCKKSVQNPQMKILLVKGC